MKIIENGIYRDMTQEEELEHKKYMESFKQQPTLEEQILELQKEIVRLKGGK